MEAASAKFENKTWKGLDDNKVQCITCSHKCIIPLGRSGICGIRKNVNGKLLLLSYGRAIARHIDPIEKKPLHHVLPGSKIYSIGLNMTLKKIII
jgi:pyruvate formate lyase activating enzyme